ncbi:MAG: hypothetical protein A3F54_04525 [Candidatus Kerfeldbacteria bacterium RIFCSPHIGHO2_12_FULL_48_17]|uniref:histidine kinase n=1 Tax=Candidatus Kerfeldbacteria bacterium RIFCSPHIGHO2_12_FULL_48_17 TaxID=1798542 RepID=A0A1G2B1N4_9BACT|nr:MAG: hypothetical protein A3F54_04525 [Candidatus Kerfeldbacteria bacterium RIFCSPHIGHO2_12_FULL_48_17]
MSYSRRTNEFERDKLELPLRWITRILWVGIVILLPGSIFLLNVDFGLFHQGALYLLIVTVVIFIVNSINTYSLHFRGRAPSTPALRTLLTANIVLMQFLFAVAVSITGGIDSLAVHVFHAVTFITISAFTSRGVILTSLNGSLLLALLYTLEHFGILPHFARFEDPNMGIYGNGFATFVNAFATILWIEIVAIFAALIGRIIKRREDVILEERHRISAIIQYLPDGILLLNTNNRLIFMNPSAENIIGIPAEKTLNHIFHPQHREQYPGRLYDLLFTQPRAPEENIPVSGPPSFEYVVGSKDRERYFEVTPLAVAEANGTPMGRMIIIHDITREKLIEKLKSEFISVAAHQLRTPLTAVKWSLQMVRDGDIGPLNEEQRQMLDKGFVSNQRMINLVNDLLDASRIEEGRFKYQPQQLDPLELLNSVAQEFEHVFKERGIVFNMSIPKTKIPFIYADPQKIRMVFQNLIDNATRYTKKSGRITVTLDYDSNNGAVDFSVADTGVGIPENQKPQIFSKFFRGENVVRMQTEGSGLGLFIVKNIVEEHGGTIRFDSQVNVGTTFYVVLPTSSARQQRIRAVQQPTP